MTTIAHIDLTLHRLEEQLANAARGINYDLRSMLNALEAGERINELGVVQGHGAPLDVLCGQRHQLYEIRGLLEGQT